jgi:hypothetical protein
MPEDVRPRYPPLSASVHRHHNLTALTLPLFRPPLPHHAEPIPVGPVQPCPQVPEGFIARHELHLVLKASMQLPEHNALWRADPLPRPNLATI